MASAVSTAVESLGWLRRATSYFLPDDFGDDPQQHFRARVVVVFAILAAICGPLYTVILYLLVEDLATSLAPLVGGLGVTLTPLLMKRGHSFVVQGNWMIFFGFGLITVIAYLGFVGPTVLLWYGLYIVLIALIAGRRSTVVWLAIMLGSTAYLYVDILQSMPQEGLVVSQTELLFELFLLLGFFPTVMALILASERFKNWALDEVQRQEAHTRAILEAAPDGIITLGADGRIGEVNEATEALFGYRRTSVEQAPFETLIPYVDDDANVLSVEGETQGDNDVNKDRIQSWVGETYQVEASRKDGRRFPAELSVTSIDDDQRYVALVRDITERKEAQRKLKEARDRAVEANEAKSRFLANISHELRTPLNAIIGYSELVGEDLEMIGEEEMGQDVGKIETAGRHLLELINEILDLSKVEAGKMELYVEEMDVATVIDEIADTLQPVIEDKDNTLRIDLEEAPETMRVDVMKFRQIMINLLSNASKFTDQGLVRIHAFREEDDGIEFGVFEVSDRGIGIPEDKLEELFDAFSQADDSTTREFGGTGLGLTICKHFSELMGGEIDVESTVGEGSTFRIKIPVDVDEARRDRDDSAVDTERHGSDITDDSKSPQISAPPAADRVLVIDDDPTVHQLMERFLSREGFAVRCTTGGGDVLDVVRDYRPDIITLDVLMPELDGWDVLERLKNDSELADIPVVMLTIVNERNLGFSLGATDYLTKPVDPERLNTVLASYLDGPDEQTILIAEDDDDTRDVLRRNIEKAGWTAVCTEDGKEALAELEGTVEADAILLDLMMPRLDGFEVLDALRGRDDIDIPVIVVSAADLSEAEQQLIDDRADALFKKGDYAKQQLLDELEAAIRRSG